MSPASPTSTTPRPASRSSCSSRRPPRCRGPPSCIRERREALVVAGSRLMALHRQQIADLVTKNRLIPAGTPRWLSEIGALLTYGPNTVELHRRAAGYVDKILKGAKPADLPMQQPATFELTIHLKTGKT